MRLLPVKELLYLEIPEPNRAEVVAWLQQTRLQPELAAAQATPDGIRLVGQGRTLVAFTWSVQNTTYLKVFQWSLNAFPRQQEWLDALKAGILSRFPQRYPALPAIDLSQESIFAALAPHYPLTAHYFQKIPNGEADLQRVYWWEKRWRDECLKGSSPTRTALILGEAEASENYDLVVVGGALGSLYAAMMARAGYRVALVERLPFGRMNREWNISRREIQTLVELGLFSQEEVESVILREYRDGFNKFFDGNSPIKAPVLRTPTVLNLAIDAEGLLRLCGQKLLAAGGQILDRSEFEQAWVGSAGVTVAIRSLATDERRYLGARLLVDAMGTASPVAQQIQRGRAFDSVCPTVGAVVKRGIGSEVWDPNYGDILCSHGDISRGRQLIWELFPGPDEELTFYLFHYHQVHPQNPGSLLEMYEDFFRILPEYRRCDLDQLEWRKATFGYIPGRFGAGSEPAGFDRVLLIGDAAAMQSPLSFTGFGSLVRNAPRLADLLDTALRHDLLSAQDLARVRAYQSNAAVTWLFSRGMMVPTGSVLPPARINSILNSFFGIMTTESPEVADDFIKDRAGWLPFTRMALKAARQNPRLLFWIWQAVGLDGIRRWLPTYLTYTGVALLGFLFGSWLPPLLRRYQTTIEAQNPRLWHRLLSWSYALTYGMGKPQPTFRLAPLPPAADPTHLPLSDLGSEAEPCFLTQSKT